MGICQLATVFQCWRILDFDSHFPGTSWGAFVSIWTLKSAGIPGCHAVLPLISKLNVLWSKTHPYSIKRRQKSFTFAWSFHGFLVCFLIFFSLWPDTSVFWWKFHPSIKLLFMGQHSPEINAVTWSWVNLPKRADSHAGGLREIRSLGITKVQEVSILASNEVF